MEVGQTKIITDISGKTYRVHRFANAVSATDLTNAGKRGKVCNRYTFYSAFNEDANNIRYSAFQSTFEIACPVEEMFEKFKDNEYGIKTQLTEHKGLRVKPKDFEDVVIIGDTVSIIADFDSFRVVDLEDENNCSKMISTSDTPRSHIKKFYRLASNGVLSNKSFTEVARKLSEVRIRYHQYCSVD